MPRLLDGLLVVDFSRVLAGPFCSMVLADLGARVIKVEQPGGDEARAFGPFVNRQSLYFASVNRGKESVALNLKHPRGLAVALDLAQRADVLLENFRPGTMERLGLGYEALSARNPRLVYCALSGFGRTGPHAGRGAYDVIIQAAAGLMSITGPEDGPPVRVGASVGDLVPALFAVAGVLAALYRRALDGSGCFLDLSMQDAMVAIVENALVRAAATGEDPRPLGSRHPTIAPFAAFSTADGDLVLAAGNDELWRRLCAALERPELAARPDFATNALRVANVDTLMSCLSEVLCTGTTAQWLARLEAAGVPASKVARMSDLLCDAHLRARRMIVELAQPGAGTIRVPGVPIKAAGYDDSPQGPAPRLGEHGPSVLAELLGLSEAAISELEQEGVLLVADQQP